MEHPTTFRFNLSPECVEHLTEFDTTNYFESSKNYKINFEKWTNNNEELINNEIEILREKGFTKNKEEVINKMYKSVRYYIHKKNNNGVVTNTKKERKTRKNTNMYLTSEIITLMKEHIEREYENGLYKPEESYNHFKQNNTEILREYITENQDQYNISNYSLERETEKTIDKIMKKSFKNKFYIFIKTKD